MQRKLSKRLADIVNNLPLEPGLRVLEIGCGAGAAAREICRRIGDGYVLAIDRSPYAIQKAITCSKTEINSGRLAFRQVSIERFKLQNDKHFDIAVAICVGALDGRHPEIEKQSLARIAKALVKNGKLFIDNGNKVKEISLVEYQYHASQ